MEHLLCSVLLGNCDGDKRSLKFLFLLYVTLMGISGKTSRICCLLCEIGKWFLTPLL